MRCDRGRLRFAAPRRALAPFEVEQRHAPRAETGAGCRARHDGQPDRIAIIIGDLVEVSGKVAAGDKLVMRPPAGLRDGAPVAVAAK